MVRVHVAVRASGPSERESAVVVVVGEPSGKSKQAATEHPLTPQTMQ